MPAVNPGRSATATAARAVAPWRNSMRPLVLPGLLVVLALAALVATTMGAAGLPPGRIAAALGLVSADQAFLERDRLVLWSIRLPRIVLAIVVGGLLAACGAVMQGLFRNPLADPALV